MRCGGHGGGGRREGGREGSTVRMESGGLHVLGVLLVNT